MLYAVRQGAPVLLVHAHSNGCDIGDMRQTLQSISESLKVHVGPICYGFQGACQVMSFEFPGYGLHLGNASMRREIAIVLGLPMKLRSIDDAAAAVLRLGLELILRAFQ